MASYEIALEPAIGEIPRLLDWIERCFAAHSVPRTTAFRVQLAVEEAIVNVIKHAFIGTPPPHWIRLRLDIDAQCIRAELVDNGKPFDPSLTPMPDCTLPVQQRPPGGLGVHLMRNMADRVEYCRRDGCNHLCIETARPVSAA